MPNLITNITTTPDLLRLIVPFLDPHSLAHIKRTCKSLRWAVPYHLVATSIKDAKERYRRVERLIEAGCPSIRVYSRLGRRTYDICPLPEVGCYLMLNARIGPLRGQVCRMRQEEKVLTVTTKRNIFNASSVRTVHIFELRNVAGGRRVLLTVELHFDDDPTTVATVYFCPCHAQAPFAYADD